MGSMCGARSLSVVRSTISHPMALKPCMSCEQKKGLLSQGRILTVQCIPMTLGMGWAVSPKKAFSFIGKRGMARDDCVRDDRKQWVGIKTKDPAVVFTRGCTGVFSIPTRRFPCLWWGTLPRVIGAKNLQRSIAQGFVKGGHARMGERVYYPLADGRVVEAEICSPIFLDPEGERQNV